jgi:hypothetical protein
MICHLRWLMALVALTGAATARAEPYLAVQQGYRCVQCHVNPTGGGLRNEFGLIFAKTAMPMVPYPEHAPNWTGKLFEHLRLGGDYRYSTSSTHVPGQASQRDSGIQQFRVYGNVELFRERLGFYVDEQVSPGKGQELELYARAGDPTKGWYLKVGRLYLPFGWRLQDSTSFVRSVSGITMTAPDEGLELGYGRSNWSAEVSVAKNANSGDSKLGNQIVGQFAWVQPRWRAGGAVSVVKSNLGGRRAIGLFAGARTGQLTWLGEADLVRDEGFGPGPRNLAALLAEANWTFHKGNNIKLTGEFFDPDRGLPEDAQTRLSLLYEFTPFPFVQLRAGWRNYDGIPQNALQNRSASFLELHAFF